MLLDLVKSDVAEGATNTPRPLTQPSDSAEGGLAVDATQSELPIPHGRPGGYNRGCRCEDCTRAQRERSRKYAASKPPEWHAERARKKLERSQARRAKLRPFVDLLGEAWLPVVGYEGRYEVSNLSRVRSLLTHKVLVQRLPNGTHTRYCTVVLYRGGKPTARKWLVHRLVLLAFVGPPQGDKTDGCHIDGDPNNNHVSNLYWGTKSENAQDRIRHGRNNMVNKTECAQGHAFSPENTGFSRGQRVCKECRARHQRNRRQRRRNELMSA